MTNLPHTIKRYCSFPEMIVPLFVGRKSVKAIEEL